MPPLELIQNMLMCCTLLNVIIFPAMYAIWRKDKLKNLLRIPVKFEFHWKSGPAPKRTESLETADSEIIATSRTIPMIAINVSIIELQVVHDCKGNIH
jgi:hypothetical protein